jgi:hypothetical protein
LLRRRPHLQPPCVSNGEEMRCRWREGAAELSAEAGDAVGGCGAVGGGSWPAVGEAARGEEDVILVGKRGGGARGGGRRSAGHPRTIARRRSTREGAVP